MSVAGDSPEARRLNAAQREARKGRSGPWTRADRRRVQKLMRKISSASGRECINLDRRAKRAAGRKFGISGKRYRELQDKARRGES